MTTKVVIKPNHFTYNGIAYFRANAESVPPGAYGEKRAPITKANYLEVKGMVPPAALKVVPSLLDVRALSKPELAAFGPLSGVLGPAQLEIVYAVARDRRNWARE